MCVEMGDEWVSISKYFYKDGYLIISSNDTLKKFSEDVYWAAVF